MILTSLGSDEAVEAVYPELFAGQEVSTCLPFPTVAELTVHSSPTTKGTELSQVDEGERQSSSTLVP